MPLILQYLRRKVLRCPAERKSPGIGHLGKPEIREFEVSIRCDQYVLRLEIAVDNILAVEILENGNNMGCVKPK